VTEHCPVELVVHCPPPENVTLPVGLAENCKVSPLTGVPEVL
jgi:hypothetical protein